MAKAKAAQQDIGENEFELDGKKYRFVIHRFQVPGFEESTPMEAKTNEALLQYLVAEKSGVIEEVY